MYIKPEVLADLLIQDNRTRGVFSILLDYTDNNGVSTLRDINIQPFYLSKGLQYFKTNHIIRVLGTKTYVWNPNCLVFFDVKKQERLWNTAFGGVMKN